MQITPAAILVEYKAVLEFMRKQNQYVKTVQTDKVPDEVVILRCRLIAEELGETFIALHESNDVEIADGLADLLYVLYGAAKALYAHPIDEFPIAAQAVKREQSKEGFMCEMLGMLKPLMLSTIERMIATIHSYAAFAGIPLHEVFMEVHRSNMTKAVLDHFSKGGKVGKSGKGDGYEPPAIAKILAAAAGR